MSEIKHFGILNAIDVNEKTEKKKSGNTDLTYLSWAWAWAETKKKYPDVKYEIKKFDGLPYVCDEKTGYMVFTSVTIEGITHEMWLPVMDGANKAMKTEPYKYKTKYDEKSVEAASMFDINKTIMRCLTKNLAMFGLGLYIYANEDLPEVEKEEREKEKKEALLKEQAQDETIRLVRESILKTAEEKIKEGVDKNSIYQVIADNNNGKKNPNSIKDLDLANKVLETIMAMKAEG